MNAVNSNLKILIVDDDHHFLKIASLLLAKQGYDSISTASNGTRGIELAKSENPDIIILDSFMPGDDGWTICQKIKKIPELKTCKIILVTSEAGGVNAEESRHVGADIYTLKTYDLSCIMEAIRKVVGGEYG